MNKDITRTTTEIMNFLAADPALREFRVTDDDNTYILMRSPYDAETDYIYELHGYHAADPHSLNREPECFGVYARPSGALYGVSYSARELVEASRVASLDDAERAVMDRAAEIVCETVEGGPVPETDDAERAFHDDEYFVQYNLEREALECYFEDKIPSFEPRLDRFSMKYADAATLALIVNHPEDAARAFADQYIIKWAKNINQRRREIPRVIRRLAELTATPGAHHLRRALAACVGDKKMVRVEIEKEGKAMTARMEAAALKRGMPDGYYSTYFMDKTGREAFAAAYGRSADLKPEDIVRVTYAGKPLYERDKVPSSATLELTPAQFVTAAREA